jgi:small subunit ribosomal protein S9
MVKEESTTKKPAAKKTAAKAVTKAAPKAKEEAEKKPRAPRKAPVKAEASAPAEVADAEATVSVGAIEKPKIAGGRYIYATGRRKTAVANVRIFSGDGESSINKKKIDAYFAQATMRDAALRPLALTGLMNDFYFVASVNGGGTNAQSEAIRHGIAQALGTLNDDVRLVLKKNGFLTRDDRKKERKKPGLRGARRAPQWAKR